MGLLFIRLPSLSLKTPLDLHPRRPASNCFAWLAARASSRSSVVRLEELEELEPRATETRSGLRGKIR